VAIKDGKAALGGDNTRIHFTGTKKDGKHDGGFKSFTGTLEMNDKGDAPTALSLEIEVGSLFSDESSGKLNGHLKSKDFFDAAKFPKVTFASTKIEPGKDGAHEVRGKLTLRGETKEISFPVKVMVAKRTVTGTSSFQINRKDFGMTYGAGMVDDMVSIHVQVGVASK
jgi:polyisoprenoid-binding protein YceI